MNNQKKKYFAMFLFLLCFLTVGVFAKSDTVQAKKISSLKQAKKLALKKVKKGQVIEIDRGYEDGVLVYEVDLMKGNKEYQIAYRASDGKMLSYAWEDYRMDWGSKKKTMSKATVKKLALKQVKKATVVRIEKDYDDGIPVYEIKLKKGGKKYVLKYQAKSRRLLEYEWELIEKRPASTGDIDVAKAKEIALQRVPGASVIRATLDFDDGREVYEVDLVKGYTEYELKIDANTGEILEMDMDEVDYPDFD